MFKPLSLLLFSALIACGLPTELDQPWRGNPLDEQADPEAVAPQTGSGSTDGGMGTPADGGEAPETCGNGELDPGEDCDETVEGSDFPCTTQCRFIDCGDGGDRFCLERSDQESDRFWHCIRLESRSVCAPAEEQVPLPDFIKASFGACLNDQGPIRENDEPVRCEADRDCNRFPDNPVCGFEIPDDLLGLCVANGFSPREDWRPDEQAVLFGWTVHLPGHEDAQCYPMACESEDTADPNAEGFCEALASEGFEGSMLKPTCVGALALDDDQRFGPENEHPLQDEMCVLVECLPDDNQDDGRNESCIHRYRIEDATCTDEGFCAARGQPLIRENMAERPPLDARCAEACRQAGGPPDPMLLCHSLDFRDDELDIGCSRCAGNEACPPGFTCDRPNPEEEGFCRATCDENQACPPGSPAECREGRCFPGGEPGGGPPQNHLRLCSQENDCGDGEYCRFSDDPNEEGFCLPTACERDQNCPPPYVCIHFECDVPHPDWLCDPRNPEEAHCSDYRPCRAIEGHDPLCLTNLSCDREAGCPAPFQCTLDHVCAARGGGCGDQNDLAGEVIHQDHGICDIARRPESQRCDPNEEDRDCPGTTSCTSLRVQADDDEEGGICTGSSCSHGRDCPMGQYCQKDSQTCQMATLCGGQLDDFRHDPAQADPTSRCPDGQVCVAAEQVFGEGSQVCLADVPMGCAFHSDCQISDPAGVCYNGRCAYQSNVACRPERLGEGGRPGQAVCVPARHHGDGDFAGAWDAPDNIADDRPEGFGLLNLDAPVYTSIDGPRDVDLFQFDAPMHGLYRFGTRYAQSGPNGALWEDTGDFDTTCWLHHANAEHLIAYNESPEDPPNRDQPSHCQIELTLAEGARIYFSVHPTDFWSDWNDPRPHVQAYVECLLGDCSEGNAEDDHGGLENATDLGQLSNQHDLVVNGVIHDAEDIDAFTFTPIGNGNITVTLSDAPASMGIQASHGGNIMASCEIGDGDPLQPCDLSLWGGGGNLYTVDVRGLGDVTGAYEVRIRLGGN